MIHPVTKLYESESINRVVMGLMHIRVPQTGTLKSIYLYFTTITGTGTWKFDINHNGTSLFPSFDDMFSLSASQTNDSKTGLNISVSRGQIIELDLKQKGFGRLFGPGALILNIDDGLDIIGAENLVDLQDVEITSLQDGQIILWSEDDDKFINADPPSSGAEELNDLSDVDTTGANEGDILVLNSGIWTPEAPPSGGGAEELSDLSDVDTSGASEGDVLVYNSGIWTPEAPSGGGGGNGIEIWFPDAPYSSPGTFDDEFNGSSLDAKWSTFNSGFTADFSDPPSMMRCQPTANQFRGIYQEIMTSGSDCDFVMKLHKPKYNPAGWNFIGFLLFTSDSIRYEVSIAPSNSIEMGDVYNVKRFFWLNNTTIFTETSLYTGLSMGHTPLYMRLKYTHSATRYELFLSENGIQWGRFMNETGMSGFPQYLGILNRGDSIADRLAGRVEFFRAMQGGVLGRKITI